ncbi:MAG: hypothetical protein HWE26_06585 [Alteromonadaceae bacterium]|nr:hypothetical protein [Alteromonadaceae bacterium]
MTDIALLTGIPRSGTTLCCKLLNQNKTTLALHEPLDPQVISAEKRTAVVNEISQRIIAIKEAVQSSKPIPLGDKDNYLVDNPVAYSEHHKGVRTLSSVRGTTTVPINKDLKLLVIKQNALFTALSSSLIDIYPLVAIIRNPVDVLLSWMTVELPVNRGRLPAGERYDKDLAKLLLQEEDLLERQLLIFSWFIDRFTKTGLKSIKYENIIDTNGQALYDCLGIKQTNSTPLTTPHRSFAPALIEHLNSRKPQLETLAAKAGYSPTIVTNRLEFLSYQNCP